MPTKNSFPNIEISTNTSIEIPKDEQLVFVRDSRDGVVQLGIEVFLCIILSLTSLERILTAMSLVVREAGRAQGS